MSEFALIRDGLIKIGARVIGRCSIRLSRHYRITAESKNCCLVTRRAVGMCMVSAPCATSWLSRAYWQQYFALVRDCAAIFAVKVAVAETWSRVAFRT
jgi:hypothetical protein